MMYHVGINECRMLANVGSTISVFSIGVFSIKSYSSIAAELDPFEAILANMLLTMLGIIMLACLVLLKQILRRVKDDEKSDRTGGKGTTKRSDTET